MTDQPDQQEPRPAHLQGLSDQQVGLYQKMLTQVSATGTDYWTTLRGMDAPAVDKYAVAAALGAVPEARQYAKDAGIKLARTFTTDRGTLTTTEVPMSDLKVGDRIVKEGVYSEDRGVHTAVYKVTGDAASNEYGWVHVRDLDVNPAERHSDGSLAAEGFFAYPADTPMHRVTNKPVAGQDTEHNRDDDDPARRFDSAARAVHDALDQLSPSPARYEERPAPNIAPDNADGARHER